MVLAPFKSTYLLCAVEKDEQGLSALIELVTEPIENNKDGSTDTQHKQVQQALSAFLGAVDTVRRCPNANPNVVGSLITDDRRGLK